MRTTGLGGFLNNGIDVCWSGAARLRHRNDAGVSSKIVNTLSDLGADQSEWPTAEHLLGGGGGGMRAALPGINTFSCWIWGDPECPRGGNESASMGWDVRVGLGGRGYLSPIIYSNNLTTG